MVTIKLRVFVFLVQATAQVVIIKSQFAQSAILDSMWLLHFYNLNVSRVHYFAYIV